MIKIKHNNKITDCDTDKNQKSNHKLNNPPKQINETNQADEINNTLQPHGYLSNLEFLDDVSTYLNHRANVLSVCEELAEIESVEQKTRNCDSGNERKKNNEKQKHECLYNLLRVVQDKEKCQNTLINTRLAATEDKSGKETLGILKFKSEYKLSETAIYILSLLCIYIISPHIIDNIFSKIHVFGALNVEEIIRLILSPKTLSDWNDARKLMKDLVKKKLIFLEYYTDEDLPELFMTSLPHLSKGAYEIMTDNLNGL